VNDLAAMRRALALARFGWGRVHPNPLVGAVIVAGGEVVGEGFHREWGREHAERVALAGAGEHARGATIFVTLMPCAHEGKQPPCTEALISAGVARVVAATDDPNPESARGADRLRAAGLAVTSGLLECEARRQNAAFFHRFTASPRPWVALKLATSLDHRIADRSGNSRWISGPAARAFVHGLRAGFDAVAVGGRTALRDDPLLTARGAIVPRIPPARVLFEGSEPLPPTLAAIRSAEAIPTIVVTAPERENVTSARLRLTGARILAATTLVGALEGLRALGVCSLLVEGGGRLAGSLLREDLVDRYYQIQSPLWLGQSGRAASAGWETGSLEGVPRWDVVERRPLGADSLLVLDRRPCSPAS
jgi:diaminohydroxyphosphoribosylaminopyrimidine deaminase/5-amino-6-(5-phosphoribosylamino)uracil reductase